MNNAIMLLAAAGLGYYLFKDKLSGMMGGETPIQTGGVDLPVNTNTASTATQAATTAAATGTSQPNTSAILTGQSVVTPVVNTTGTPLPTNTVVANIPTEAGTTGQTAVVTPGGSIVVIPAGATTSTNLNPGTITQPAQPAQFVPPVYTTPVNVPTVNTTDAAVVSIGAFQGQLPNPNNYPYLMREMNSYGGDYITVLRQGSAGRVIIGDLNFRLPIQWWNSFRYGQGLSVVQPVEARGAWDTPLNQEEYLTLVQDPNIFWDQYWPAIQSRSGLSGLMGVGMGGWA